jgi:hypothetical protein
MNFGVVQLPHLLRAPQLAKRAEELGFSHASFPDARFTLPTCTRRWRWRRRKRRPYALERRWPSLRGALRGHQTK